MCRLETVGSAGGGAKTAASNTVAQPQLPSQLAWPLSQPLINFCVVPSLCDLMHLPCPVTSFVPSCTERELCNSPCCENIVLLWDQIASLLPFPALSVWGQDPTSPHPPVSSTGTEYKQDHCTKQQLLLPWVSELHPSKPGNPSPAFHAIGDIAGGGKRKCSAGGMEMGPS